MSRQPLLCLKFINGLLLESDHLKKNQVSLVDKITSRVVSKFITLLNQVLGGDNSNAREVDSHRGSDPDH